MSGTAYGIWKKVACQHMINRRQYLQNAEQLRNAYRFSEKLFAKLQAFRTTLLTKPESRIREELADYELDSDIPF